MNEAASITLVFVSGLGLGLLGICFARWAGIISDRDWARFWGRKVKDQ